MWESPRTSSKFKSTFRRRKQTFHCTACLDLGMFLCRTISQNRRIMMKPVELSKGYFHPRPKNQCWEIIFDKFFLRLFPLFSTFFSLNFFLMMFAIMISFAAEFYSPTINGLHSIISDKIIFKFFRSLWDL